MRARTTRVRTGAQRRRAGRARARQLPPRGCSVHVHAHGVRFERCQAQAARLQADAQQRQRRFRFLRFLRVLRLPLLLLCFERRREGQPRLRLGALRRRRRAEHSPCGAPLRRQQGEGVVGTASRTSLTSLHIRELSLICLRCSGSSAASPRVRGSSTLAARPAGAADGAARHNPKLYRLWRGGTHPRGGQNAAARARRGVARRAGSCWRGRSGAGASGPFLVVNDEPAPPAAVVPRERPVNKAPASRLRCGRGGHPGWRTPARVGGSVAERCAGSARRSAAR
jgi:hypothetical protein